MEYTKLVSSVDDIESSRKTYLFYFHIYINFLGTGPALGFLQAEAAEIRAIKINWASYLQYI